MLQPLQVAINGQGCLEEDVAKSLGHLLTIVNAKETDLSDLRLALGATKSTIRDSLDLVPAGVTIKKRAIEIKDIKVQAEEMDQKIAMQGGDLLRCSSQASNEKDPCSRQRRP